MSKLLTCAAIVAVSCVSAACKPPAPSPESASKPAAKAVAATGYALMDRIPGPDGGYDYLSLDSEQQRLFVGRSYGVMAVDLATNTVIDRLVEAYDAAAVLIIPGTDLMLSTAYDGDSAILFDRMTGEVKARVQTGKGPDAAAFDAASGLIFVMNAKSNDTTLIDVKSASVVASIPLGGKPEAAASNGQGRVFINIEDTAEVAVVDVAQRKVTGRFALPGCEEPTGLAYDAASKLLISACHNRTVKLIDSETGADRGSVAVGENADGSIFDATRRLVYVPCVDGTLSIFPLDESGRPRQVEVVKTQPGARTAALDPVSGRIYLAASEFTTDKEGEYVPVPGTFNVLVVAQ